MKLKSFPYLWIIDITVLQDIFCSVILLVKITAEITFIWVSVLQTDHYYSDSRLTQTEVMKSVCSNAHYMEHQMKIVFSLVSEGISSSLPTLMAGSAAGEKR